MKVILLFISLILFGDSKGQDTSKIKFTDSVVDEINMKIENYDNVLDTINQQGEKFFFDTFKKGLLKVISHNGPAPGQVVTYYFINNKFLKAEVRQVRDSLVQYIEHHYFDKKKQILEKLEADEDTAIVSWDSKLFFKNAKTYLLASKTLLFGK